MSKTADVKLTGYALAKVKLVKKRDGDIVFHTQRIVSMPIECEAVKHIEYDSYEIYTIDNSFYDYGNEDIRPADPFEFVIVNKFDCYKLEQLEMKKDINKYIEDKRKIGNIEDLEIEKIIKIYEYDLEEK